MGQLTLLSPSWSFGLKHINKWIPKGFDWKVQVWTKFDLRSKVMNSISESCIFVALLLNPLKQTFVPRKIYAFLHQKLSLKKTSLNFSEPKHEEAHLIDECPRALSASQQVLRFSKQKVAINFLLHFQSVKIPRIRKVPKIIHTTFK